MQSTASTTLLNRRVVRLLQVAGGAVLIVLVVHNPELAFCNTLGDAGSLTIRKRGLQGVRYDTRPGDQQLQEQHYAWPPPREEHERRTKHSHSHYNGGHERNTDDDDSQDDTDDDDSKDEHDDHDKDSSESLSRSGSSSTANETESAAIQSSVVTNLDGVNIGNTITIINIGTGSAGQQSSSASADNEPNGNNSFAVNAAGRSAITSAAVRAFCDSIGCSPTKGSTITAPVTGLGSSTFSWGGGNNPKGNEATYNSPVASSGPTVVNLGLVKWLLLITMIIQLV